MDGRVAAQLSPRPPWPKPPTISKPSYESRLTLKFRDDLKVRAANGDLVSQVGGDLAGVGLRRLAPRLERRLANDQMRSDLRCLPRPRSRWKACQRWGWKGCHTGGKGVRKNFLASCPAPVSFEYGTTVTVPQPELAC